MKLGSTRTSDVVAVEFTEDHLKFVQGRSMSGQLIIRAVAHGRVESGGEEEVVRRLTQWMKSFKVRTKEIICVVPSRSFISKNVDMPSMDREEIRKIVDLQANRYTPYSRDEIVFDHICVDTPEQHYTNVVLIIMNRKLSEKYCGITEKAGLEIRRLCIASEGVAATYRRKAQLDAASDSVGGIHVDQISSDLTIADNGQIVFIRSIPIGAQNFLGHKDEAQAEFLKQLNKSLIAYQNQGIGRPIKMLILAGLMEGLSFLEAEIRKNIPYVFASNIPMKIIRDETCFQLDEHVAESMKRDSDVSYFELMACLSASQEIKIDLIPSEIRLKEKFKRSGKELMQLAITVMAMFLLISVMMASKMQLKGALLKKMDDVNEKSFNEARVLERASTKTRTLRNVVQAQGTGLYVFEKVNGLIGEDMYLSQFTYDQEGSVKLAGTADSMSRVFSFVTDLEGSRFFKEVNTTKTKSKREGQKDVAEFEIECNFVREP